MLRIGVSGRTGQLAQSLDERAPLLGAQVVMLARPHADLLDADSIARAVEASACDAIVNAAAYTAVDRAEAEPDLAMAINADGARHVARAAKSAGIPMIQISSDYVFDGRSPRPYREADGTAPLSAYGRSKLAGERAVAETWADYVILRTAWIYSATGHNFVRRMLQLGETRSAVSVVTDQRGSPTYGPDLADAIVSIAAQLVAKPGAAALRGIFHTAGTGDASRFELAEAIFTGAARRGRAMVRVDAITAKDYPTVAPRPSNSCLDARKLETLYDLKLPNWRQSLESCLDRLISPLQESNRVRAGG